MGVLPYRRVQGTGSQRDYRNREKRGREGSSISRTKQAVYAGIGVRIRRLDRCFSAHREEKLGMAFIKEFAENWIRRSMEDPEERDRKFREHIQTTKAKCDRIKEAWAQPTKPYGSWNTDKNNHKFLMDLRLGRMPGRVDPVEQTAIDVASRN